MSNINKFVYFFHIIIVSTDIYPQECLPTSSVTPSLSSIANQSTTIANVVSSFTVTVITIITSYSTYSNSPVSSETPSLIHSM